jgi:hypothetical protein
MDLHNNAERVANVIGLEGRKLKTLEGANEIAELLNQEFNIESIRLEGTEILGKNSSEISVIVDQHIARNYEYAQQHQQR